MLFFPPHSTSQRLIEALFLGAERCYEEGRVALLLHTLLWSRSLTRYPLRYWELLAEHSSISRLHLICIFRSPAPCNSSCLLDLKVASKILLFLVHDG